MDERQKNSLSEAILRYAVIENHKRELAEIPTNEELANLYTFSERHTERMNKLLTRADRRERFRGFRIVAKRVATVVLITITVLFGLMLTSPTVRAAIRETIIEWYEQFTNFRFSEETPVSEPKLWYPAYLPTGFIEIDAEVLPNISTYEFDNSEGVKITFICSVSNGTSLAVDNEHSEYELINESGIEYHVFRSKSSEYPSEVVWEKDGYGFFLNSVVDANELVKVAFSINTPNK